MWTVTLDPTLSGGTPTNLSSSGFAPGKAMYTWPGGSRLEGVSITLTSSQKGSASAPVASTGVKVIDKIIDSSESCCSVTANQIVWDVGVRYPLLSGVDAAAVTASYKKWLAVVSDAEFLTAILDGTFPQ